MEARHVFEPSRQHVLSGIAHFNAKAPPLHRPLQTSQSQTALSRHWMGADLSKPVAMAGRGRREMEDVRQNLGGQTLHGPDAGFEKFQRFSHGTFGRIDGIHQTKQIEEIMYDPPRHSPMKPLAPPPGSDGAPRVLGGEPSFYLGDGQPPPSANPAERPAYLLDAKHRRDDWRIGDTNGFTLDGSVPPRKPRLHGGTLSYEPGAAAAAASAASALVPRRPQQQQQQVAAALGPPGSPSPRATTMRGGGSGGGGGGDGGSEQAYGKKLSDLHYLGVPTSHPAPPLPAHGFRRSASDVTLSLNTVKHNKTLGDDEKSGGGGGGGEGGGVVAHGRRRTEITRNPREDRPLSMLDTMSVQNFGYALSGEGQSNGGFRHHKTDLHFLETKFDQFKKREAENLFLAAAEPDVIASNGRPQFGRRKNPSLLAADLDLLQV